MDCPDARAVWKTLEGRVGDRLRAVIRYDGFEYESVTRADVRERYTDDDALHLVNDIVVNQLTLADSEDLFDAGRYRAFIRVFDDAWIVTLPDDPPAKTGYVVSFDREEGASSVDIDAHVRALEALVSDDVAHDLEYVQPNG
jgi:hypothetical protein